MTEGVWEDWRRYERALEKANYRSLALRNNAAEAGGSEEAQEEGEEEAELQETLAWARRAAQAKAEGLSDIAAVAARRRQQQEAADREGGSLPPALTLHLPRNRVLGGFMNVEEFLDL